MPSMSTSDRVTFTRSSFSLPPSRATLATRCSYARHGSSSERSVVARVHEGQGSPPSRVTAGWIDELVAIVGRKLDHSWRLLGQPGSAGASEHGLPGPCASTRAHHLSSSCHAHHLSSPSVPTKRRAQTGSASVVLCPSIPVVEDNEQRWLPASRTSGTPLPQFVQSTRQGTACST